MPWIIRKFSSCIWKRFYSSYKIFSFQRLAQRFSYLMLFIVIFKKELTLKWWGISFSCYNTKTSEFQYNAETMFVISRCKVSYSSRYIQHWSAKKIDFPFQNWFCERRFFWSEIKTFGFETEKKRQQKENLPSRYSFHIICQMAYLLRFDAFICLWSFWNWFLIIKDSLVLTALSEFLHFTTCK